MNCRDWEERIALHAERDLPPHEAAEAERHLAECAECREFSESITQTLAELRGAHVEPLAAADFAAVRARVLAELPPQRRPAWRLAWVGVAAAIVLLVTVQVEKRRVERAGVIVNQPAPTVEVAIPLPPAPQAPEPVSSRRPKHVAHPRPLRKPAPPSEPLMVRLISDDPDVVIYWIAN